MNFALNTQRTASQIYLNITRVLGILLLALVFLMMFASCDTAQSVGYAIGRFFIFLLWLVLAICSLIGCIFIYHQFFDLGESPLLPYAGFFVSCACIFFITRMLGNTPNWLLVIGVIAHIGILLGVFYMIFDDNTILYEYYKLNGIPLYIWLVSAVVFGTLYYISGLMNHAFELQNFSITVTPIYGLTASGFLALLPAFITYKIKNQKYKAAVAEQERIKEEKKRKKEEKRLQLEKEAEERRLRRKKKAEERKIRLEKEAEEKREKEEKEKRRLARIERKKPIAVKLAELDFNEKKQLNKNEHKIKIAEQKFTELEKHRGKSPDSLYKGYLKDAGKDKAFNFNIKEDLSGKSLIKVRERYNNLLQIAQYYNAELNMQKATAKLENDRYTYSRKKAELFVQSLKDVWKHLVEKQKKLTIEDAAEKFNINTHEMTIQDESVYIPDARFEISSESFYAISESFEDAWDNFIYKLDEIKDLLLSIDPRDIQGDRGTALALYFGWELGKTGLSGAGELLLNGVKAVSEGVVNFIEARQEQKREYEDAVNGLHGEINKIIDARSKNKMFCERARELNASLEKVMEAYQKIFVEVFDMLYPKGDVSKTKEARTKNEKNGGYYFSDEEAGKVIKLRHAGHFLLKLAVTKFEGE